MANEKCYGVTHECTNDYGIWHGWYDSLQEAVDYAMKYHFSWCQHWGKALYLTDSQTGEEIYLVHRKTN